MAEASGSDTSSSSKCSESMGMGMKGTIKMIRAKFPKVKDITTDTLDDWMQAGPEKNNIVLMDCRDETEFAVSHLPQAQHVDWQTGDPEQLLNTIPTDGPYTVVCYCSVGYRSSSLAGRLQDFIASSPNSPGQSRAVYNLEGSIFKWANEGRAMVDAAEQPTKLCHPYNFIFGKLLNKELRSKDVASPDCS